MKPEVILRMPLQRLADRKLRAGNVTRCAMEVCLRRWKGLFLAIGAFNFLVRKKFRSIKRTQAIACIFFRKLIGITKVCLNRSFRNANSKQPIWSFIFFTVWRSIWLFIEFRSSSLATFRWRLVNITGLRPCTRKAPEGTRSLWGTPWSVPMHLRSFRKNLSSNQVYSTRFHVSAVVLLLQMSSEKISVYSN